MLGIKNTDRVMSKNRSSSSRIRRNLKLFSWRLDAIKNFRRAVEPLFILGTGRSGTHFLTHTLIKHSSITDLTNGTENEFVFPLSTQQAIQGESKAAMHKLIKRYRVLSAAAAPKLFLDQSHPNIWHAETLADAFPECKFLMIVRNPYSVVQSMMHHSGVRRWVVEWERYPVPNRFLGIHATNLACYKRYSLEERCAVRWAAHFVRTTQLEDKFPQRSLVVSYEKLCEEPELTCNRMTSFLRLEQAIPCPTVNLASLNKRQHLSMLSRRRIKGAIEGYFGSEACNPPRCRNWIDRLLLDY